MLLDKKLREAAPGDDPAADDDDEDDDPLDQTLPIKPPSKPLALKDRRKQQLSKSAAGSSSSRCPLVRRPTTESEPDDALARLPVPEPVMDDSFAEEAPPPGDSGAEEACRCCARSCPQVLV